MVHINKILTVFDTPVIMMFLFIELLVKYTDIQFGQLIGRGNFGSVYQGRWKGKSVALKRINIPPGVDRENMIATSRELAALKYV